MSDIPADVVIETLVRLPVKSLLKFRCVCKSWRSLIDSKRFVKMHLNHSLELKRANVNSEFILCGYSSLCHVSFDSHNSCIDFHSTTLNYPLKNDVKETFVLGYCNGLLLIFQGLLYHLWNPSTRKYCELPSVEPKKNNPQEKVHHWSAGLGYDKISDDYKVVSLQCSGDNEGSWAETLVYSVQSNSWRRTKEPPVWIFQPNSWRGIFVFGALHWVVFVPRHDPLVVYCSAHGYPIKFMIAAFDLGSEEYEYVPMPLNFAAPERIDLGIFDECLSMSCNYNGDRVDIWLMRDPKNRESWAKFLSLKQVGVLASLKENVIPISYASSRRYVILEKDREVIFLYDMELKKSVRIIRTGHGPSTFITYLYMECLDQPKSRSREEVSKKMYQAEEKQNKPKNRDDFLSRGFKLKL